MQVRVTLEEVATMAAFKQLKQMNFTRSDITSILIKEGMKKRAAEATAEQLLRQWRSAGIVIYQGHKDGWKFV